LPANISLLFVVILEFYRMSNRSTRNSIPEKLSKYSKLHLMIQCHCGKCKGKWVESRTKLAHETEE